MHLVGGIATVLFATQIADAKVAKDKIAALPGWSKALPSEQYSGYLDAGAGKHLHYWLVESESPTAKTDPVVFWFNGGPGCSSLDGYFYEHGPFHVIEPVDNTSAVPPLYLNPSRWSQVANVVYLESPAGVGFSYADTPAGIVHNDTSTAEDAYAALTVFFEGFPEYQPNDFYISGESYAGMYVPTLALQVLEHNDQHDARKAANLVPDAPKINLKGILVGNGVTGEGSIPEDVGLGNDVEFFFGHGLYNSSLHDAIVKECGDYKSPSDKCEGLIGQMHTDLGHINVYDIYTPCIMDMEKDQQNKLPSDHRAPFSAERAERFGTSGPDGCIDAGAAKKYLDVPVVRKALHVDVPAKNGKEWAICGGIQYSSDFGSLLPHYKNTLIPAIKVLIFNGDVDCCVPYKGNEWWTSSLEMPLEKGWRQWTVNSQTAGYVTSYASDFTFLTVKGSGHMVPQYRPVQALAMFERFVTGQAFDCEATNTCKPSVTARTEL